MSKKQFDYKYKATKVGKPVRTPKKSTGMKTPETQAALKYLKGKGPSPYGPGGKYEPKKEGVEIDELSKKVLGRYVKQAAHDTAGAGIDLGVSSRKKGGQTRADVDKHAGKILKRQRGIGKAVDKLSKEDMSLAPKGKGRKAAKALYKEGEVTPFGNILRQAIEEAKKVDAIKEINKIVKTKTMGKLHGQKVDLFTASAIQQVYKAINHKNKEKMNSVMSKDIHGLLKMADFSMSKMKR